jgi:hypothetical protein
LVGENESLDHSYATGDVYCDSPGCYGGGLIGHARLLPGRSLDSAYSIGKPSGSGAAGGSVGKKSQHGTITSVYWDISTSKLSQACGKGHCDAIIGLSDKQLTSGLPAGFDPNFWGQSPNINNGYPYLLGNPPQ